MAYVLKIIMMIFNVSVLKDTLDNIASMVNVSKMIVYDLNIYRTNQGITQSKRFKHFNSLIKILQTPVPQWIATMEALVVLKSTLAPLSVLATMDTMEVTVKKVSIENPII